MPITKSIQVFTYQELEGKAKENARNWLQELETSDSDWSMSTIETEKEELQKVGYSKPVIMFSGFGSQGDGACFTSPVDIELWVKENKHELPASFLDLVKED